MSKKRRNNKPQQSNQTASQSSAQPSRPQSPQGSPASVKPLVEQSVQTISQERAKHALKQVKSWAGNDKDDQKALRSYASNLPAMVLMSGFGQACAFYCSKGGNHGLLYGAVASWLCDKKRVYNTDDLMGEIVACDAARYQLAQAEALEYLDWLKKFAKAYLQGEEDAATS
ncbi:MAG: type III-B CRISPR module-associated protein Cmr5 [Zetaproteobacteria bacterium CG_4_9_14_3_um_filter_49_83]|nr:MAG: type III-B CRISPR module-associated protein Cmr5 [Zetaproteobacteria bacterium CG17_big_fil_post_rev_8_21_14_2_50_50_13]PIV30576.1 MAG: type III-B CRISPR module-associated protein Cmr5 [Zetaproteobacteria bacterium CG02_land_8_20_14_3_00_50_9]PJA35506.1 MAG: type III-B CRISPR module-associated protein Cmr5 [Zetaproteobacteria bacterium CG_4_9_14_3_um_filter_49_83]